MALAHATPSMHPILLGSSVLLLGSIMLALGVGAVEVSPAQIVAMLFNEVGWTGEIVDETSRAVIVAIRLPRVILGAAAGAGLGMAGAAMQALFRNPLADPGVIGVSSGAALAAAAVVVIGGPAAPWTVPMLPIAAFAGGLAATAIVHRVSTITGHTSVRHLLLTGVAMNSFFGAATGILVFLASDAQLRTLTFWNLGSLGGATWQAVATSLPWLLIALVSFPRLAAGLNAMLLGEAEVVHLGFDADILKRRVILLTVLAVGAAVAVTGVIGFVGLVVPHLTRLLLGPDHSRVLPCAAMLGAALLLLADVGARCLAAPAEIPIGILTAFIGAPFLLWLVSRDPGPGL